jgi:predicted GNAT family acetyltransferase
VFFTNNLKEFKVQFVWDKFLYDVNISKKYQLNRKQIIYHNTNKENYRFPIWFDPDIGTSTPSELVVSPSGRWTVYNWYNSISINNSIKYSISQVTLIDNSGNLNFKDIVSDSGKFDNDKISYWKNAVFTKYDSTFLLRETLLQYTSEFTPVRVTNRILEVSIQGDNSAWKTSSGLYLGLTLQEVEKINAKNFTISGFGWAHGGSVVSWEGGKLAGDSTLTHQVSFRNKRQNISVEEFNKISGEAEFDVRHPSIQQMNPTLEQITILKPYIPSKEEGKGIAKKIQSSQIPVR